jgi:hypothetical protein
MEHPDANPDVISTDWICVGCGYNLRGLGRSGRCPECNTPIARSLRMARLANSDPRWLALVRDGAMIVAACDLVSAARTLLLIALRYALQYRALTRAVLPYRIALLSTGVRLTIVGAAFVGAWLLAKPEPRPLSRGSAKSAIRLRQLYVCALAATLIYNFLLVKYFLVDVQRAWGIFESLLWMLICFLLWRYLTTLARRLNQLRLLERARALRWLLPLGIAGGRLVYLTLYFFGLASMRTHPTPFIIAECSEQLIVIWEAIVLFQFAAAIKHMLKSPETAAPNP